MSRPTLAAVAATVLLAGCGSATPPDGAQVPSVMTTIPPGSIEPAPSPTLPASPSARPPTPLQEPPITDPAY